MNETQQHYYQPLIEGLLFIAGDDGLTLQDLKKGIEVEESIILEILTNIATKYESDDFGFMLVNYGDVYKFLSKPFVANVATKLFTQIEGSYLSQAALEVLSIVAYKQPITRVEIEEIRGVGCDMMLRKLMARDLIEEAGRSEAIGRPILYQVTQHFLDCFKLLSLNELPDLPNFSNEGNNTDLFANSDAKDDEDTQKE